MEPLDPGKNIEGSGCSKRRISSILKAPRKSSVLRDSEQQENEVETAKLVEKRNSRRVSFAPANDVLLFAKDAKNGSPARSPLQELMGAATATTQNRVQVVTTEDTSPQIVGIETLLNAPLHASQQRIMVNFDSGNDFGEKTVIFSTDDAVMDMTHSHTININSDAELLEDLSHHNYDLLLSGERNEIDVFTDVPPSHFVQARNQSSATLIDKKADSSMEKGTLSTPVPLLDPGFKDFLSSLSKPSPSSTSAVLTRTTPSAGPSFDEIKSSLGQSETQSSDVDKENQVPKCLSSSRNIGEAFHGSAFHPEDDVSMDMTAAQTGCILGVNDDDHPFQCLLPTQEMYEKSERRASQAREMKMQQSFESLESNDLKAKKSLANPSVHTPHESYKVCSVLKNDCREKTVVFMGDEFMDITQSHTGNIISSSLTPALMSANSFDLPFTEFPVSLSKISNSSGNPENPRIQPITTPSSKQTVSTEASLLQYKIPRNDTDKENYPLSTNRSCSEPLLLISPKGDLNMDMTEVRTGCIIGGDISMDMTEVQTGHITGALGSDDPFQFLIPSQEIQPLCKSQKKEVFTFGQQIIEGQQPSHHKGMETSSKLSLNMEPKRHQDKVIPPDDFKEKTLRFSADDACLDVTQSHTVYISTNIKQDSHQNVNVAPTCGEKTMRFAADDAAMDMTQCLTMNIATNLASDLITSVSKQEDPSENRFSSSQSLSTLNDCDADLRMMAATESSDGFTVNQEDDMDMTEAHTSRILGAEVSISMNMTGEMPRKRELLLAVLPTEGMHRESVRGRTEGNTHQYCNETFGASNYAGTSTKTSLKTVIQRNQVEFDSKDDCREKTVRFAAADGCKDVTRCNTLDISSDLPLPNMVLAANGEKTVRFNANDAEMDVTKSHTVNIMRDLPLQSFPNVVLPANAEKTVRFNANDADMDVTRSHTVDIAHDLNVLVHKKGDFLPAHGERTWRFGANEAEMDVTKSHTVNIMRDLPLQPFPNVAMPSDGEKTVRFSSNDAAMDVTRSHTVKIFTDFKMLSNQNESSLPAGGEKTVRFTTNDATMDVTRSHTVNIVHDLNLLAHQKVGALPADGESTVRFGVNDAEMEVTKSLTVKILADSNVASDQIVDPPPAKEENLTWLAANDVTMDVTRSHTVSIITDFDQNPSQIMDSSSANTESISNTLVDETGSDTKSISKNYKLVSHRNVELLPKSGVKATTFTSDATMDMTHCLSVNIVSNQLLDPVTSDQNATSMHENMNNTLAKKESDCGNCGLDSNPSSSAKSEHAALNNSLFQTSCAQGLAKGDAPLCPNSSYSRLKTKEPETDAVNESPSLVSDVVGKPANETKTDSEETYAIMDMGEDQTEPLASSTDNPPQGVSSKQDPHSKSFKESDLTFQSDGALGSSVSDEHHPEAETQSVSQKMESSPSYADQSADVLPSRISRRKSLADLQSKVRRLSQLINAAPDATAMENCTAPLSHQDPDLDKTPNGKTSSPAMVEPVLEVDSGKNTNVTEAEHLPVATSTTPFSLKTKQLMSRLSVGGFKPKLPKRKTAGELKKSACKGEPTKTFTVSIPNQLSRFDKITDIHDEELVDCEDFSETIDTMTPEKISKKENTSDQFSTFPPLQDDAFMDDFTSSSQRQKRSLPENEDEREDEKRQKMCTRFTETASQPDVECDSNITTARTQTIDSSSSTHTIRCESASESNFKHSLFESQLEDYSSEGQNKLEDGTITVLEFFNLFSIDFVIHNPRQSVLPGRLLDNSDATPLDLLKDKHISRPKQTVYETDVQTLKEKVEALKYRMQDLGKPLKTVNRSLWEEVKHFTEKELKSFGAKLKERNNFFRKNSKVQSHEMKEVLYANLVLANLEEQQKLRGTINQADEMIQSLDSCVAELEAELDAVEEKGSEDKPSLKSLQEEMSKATETLADSERQISELDFGKTKNSSDLKRLKAEERNLQSYIDTLNMLNEWRLEQKDDNCPVYSFLHRTLFLRLVYGKTSGKDGDSRSERKVTNISFKFNLSDEKSQSHARLVHKLVSQYIEGESSWVEKYPTSRHVPKLLHDVSLVASRCRLVGEELRLLKMWGSLRFDILDISCSETQVHVVFSSLKKLSKFEVVFAARLIDQLCVFHLQSVKNLIGNTTIQQIEEVVASLSPGKNLFTRIVKKLHETLLS
ncbi:uncharacterized protein knl1 isoform 2-T2 [Anableps anableps]